MANTRWYTYFILICCKNCIVCLKRTKNKQKEAEICPFLRKSNSNRGAHSRTGSAHSVSYKSYNRIFILAFGALDQNFNYCGASIILLHLVLLKCSMPLLPYMRICLCYLICAHACIEPSVRSSKDKENWGGMKEQINITEKRWKSIFVGNCQLPFCTIRFILALQLWLDWRLHWKAHTFVFTCLHGRTHNTKIGRLMFIIMSKWHFHLVRGRSCPTYLGTYNSKPCTFVTSLSLRWEWFIKRHCHICSIL